MQTISVFQAHIISTFFYGNRPTIESLNALPPQGFLKEIGNLISSILLVIHANRAKKLLQSTFVLSALLFWLNYFWSHFNC